MKLSNAVGAIIYAHFRSNRWEMTDLSSASHRGSDTSRRN